MSDEERDLNAGWVACIAQPRVKRRGPEARISVIQTKPSGKVSSVGINRKWVHGRPVQPRSLQAMTRTFVLDHRILRESASFPQRRGKSQSSGETSQETGALVAGRRFGFRAIPGRTRVGCDRVRLPESAFSKIRTRELADPLLGLCFQPTLFSTWLWTPNRLGYLHKGSSPLTHSRHGNDSRQMGRYEGRSGTGVVLDLTSGIAAGTRRHRRGRPSSAGRASPPGRSHIRGESPPPSSGRRRPGP